MSSHTTSQSNAHDSFFISLRIYVYIYISYYSYVTYLQQARVGVLRARASRWVRFRVLRVFHRGERLLARTARGIFLERTARVLYIDST